MPCSMRTVCFPEMNGVPFVCIPLLSWNLCNNSRIMRSRLKTLHC